PMIVLAIAVSGCAARAGYVEAQSIGGVCRQPLDRGPWKKLTGSLCAAAQATSGSDRCSGGARGCSPAQDEHDLEAIAHGELLEDRAHVRLGRSQRDAERPCNL